MKKLIIFDLDGTILDTLEDLTDSTNFALSKNNMPEHTISEVRSFVGNGIRKLIERAVPQNTSVEVIDKVFADFKEYYNIHCMDKTKPYTGITDLMDKLKKAGYKLAIISNKADDAVQILREQFYKEYIDYAAGEIEGVERKPSPEAVNICLADMQILKEEAVYVGDSDVDVATAYNSGVDFIAVLWGFRDKTLLLENGAKKFAEDTNELFDIISKM